MNSFFQAGSKRLFLFLITCAYLLPAWHRGLWVPDESRYAEISREMIQRGDWVVPHLLGLLYFEKPIAGYWLNSLCMLLFGETHLAVRMASVVSAWLSAWLVFVVSTEMFRSQRKAWLASVCYLTGLLVYGIATYSVIDSMLALWLNLMLVAFYIGVQTERARTRLLSYAVVGLAVGMAFLTKGFLAFVVLALVALPYLVYRRRLADLRYLGLVLLCILLVSLPWSLVVAQRAPDFWHYFFWVEHVQRFAADNAQHKAPFWYYLPYLLLGLLPWLGLAPATFKRAWQDVSIRPAVVYLLLWLLLPLLLFSIAKGKLPTYILPCFTPLAVLLGYGLDELQQQQAWRFFRANGWCNLVFGTVLALGLVLLGLGYLGANTIYAPTEHLAWALGAGIFLYWAWAGWMAIRQPQRSMWPTLLAPLILGTLFDWAMPATLVSSKMPEIFISQHQPLLRQARYVLASNDGMAYSLAWRLGRDDIQIYGKQGELSYGLEASGAVDKALSREDFKRWLPVARRQGDVALLVQTDADQPPEILPDADQVITQNRLILRYYRAQP
jgi:4-amino-4-deoxy-L-arabinose transferase